MQLDLRPLAGVGPVQLGASLTEAQAVLSALEGFVPPNPLRPRQAGSASFESGLSIALHTDRSEGVIAIEVYGSGIDHVTFDGLDVFMTPAEQVIEELASRTVLRLEEGGRTVILEENSMSLWRATLPEGPDDEDGRYFESVLVARAGYFSLPESRG